MSKIIEAAASIIAALIGALVTTWTIYVLWGWYAVPAGLPDVTMKTVFGMGLIVTLMTFQSPPAGTKHTPTPAETISRIIAYSVVFPLALLGSGAIIKAIF